MEKTYETTTTFEFEVWTLWDKEWFLHCCPTRELADKWAKEERKEEGEDEVDEIIMKIVEVVKSEETYYCFFARRYLNKTISRNVVSEVTYK